MEIQTRRLAKFRPCAPILAVTFDEVTQRSLLPVNGVTPVVSNIQNNKENDIDLARNLALQVWIQNRRSHHCCCWISNRIRQHKYDAYCSNLVNIALILRAF